jgi:hypothetical protein
LSYNYYTLNKQEYKMSNTWDYLPNAKHIDAILASFKAHPKEWSAARYAARDAAWDAARDAAWSAACSAAYYAARDAAYYAARDEVRDAAWSVAYYAARDAAYYAACDAASSAAWDAILALIAYDDCAYMLDSDPGELEILAKLGDERAILLLPACKAFAAINKIHKPVIA